MNTALKCVSGKLFCINEYFLRLRKIFVRDIYLLVIVRLYLRGFPCFQCLNMTVVNGRTAIDPYQQVGINNVY